MYEERQISDDLKRYSEKYADRMAIIGANDENVITYRELWQDIISISGNLTAQGVQTKDTILAILDNSPRSMQLMLACVVSGFNYAPIACGSTISEVKKFLKITDSKYALVENTVHDSLVNSIASDVRLIDLENIIKKTDHNLVKIKCGKIYIGTSGSVGEPKIMRIDADRLWSSGYNFLKMHSVINENSRFYNILPMSYLGGLFNLGIAPLSIGASVVIDNAFSGASFLDFWQKVERFNISVLWLVPTIMRGLLELSKRINRKKYIQYPAVDVCLLGTAPISIETKTSFEELTSIPVIENYALSETTFITTETIESNNLRKEGSVGSVLPWVNIKIKNNKDERNAQSNSILVKTPSIMAGYLGDEAKDN